MTSVLSQTAGKDIVEASSPSAVSWGAILAGAFAASAASLLLIALGSEIGLVSVSPWANSGVSAQTFGILAIAWFAAVQLFSSGLGGYIAGRLRGRWIGVHTDEVYFRDTAHGFLVWAVGAVISASLLASVLSSGVAGAAHVAGGALSTAAGAGASRLDPQQYFTDMLFRSDRPGAAADVAASHAEIGRILARTATSGDLSAPDKAYVAQTMARETGLSQADAEKRLTDVVAQAKASAADAAAKVKQAADDVRNIAEAAALWAFVSLLIGAFAASYMAMVGGRLRDEMPAFG